MQNNGLSRSQSNRAAPETASQNSTSQTPSEASLPVEKLTSFLEQFLENIGYELVAIEIQNHREKSLRIFADSKNGFGIEDCVKVTRELDEPLDQLAELEEIFKGPYELEVSSPGIERPLRKPSDYARFAGQIGRLSTFRALTAEETQALEYSTKNPKQKNFYGILRGFEDETRSVMFGVIPDDGTRDTKPAKKGTKKKKEEVSLATPLKNETLIRIPLNMIAKAHLEPVVEYPEE